MAWSEQYTQADKPALIQIEEYIGSPLWRALCTFVETNYDIQPNVEYSLCSGAPGWNVKYKKGGRALCTLYPREGFFTCLVCIGAKEATEAELVLSACSPAVQELYRKAKPLNGTRWLMIDVTAEAVLEDVKRLLFVRAKPKPKKDTARNRA